MLLSGCTTLKTKAIEWGIMEAAKVVCKAHTNCKECNPVEVPDDN